jgi:transcriptional regulator with XRE-family HTH domain
MPTSFGRRLGARIRASREALGLTQEQLAEAAHVTSNYVGVLERGQKLPSLDALDALARALKTSPAELLGQVRVQDEWLDELVSVAQTVPRSRRALALELLHVLAAKEPRRRTSR